MSRYAGWLPSNHTVYRDFMKTHHKLGIKHASADVAHEPAVAQFEQAINADPELKALFDLVFLQAAQLGEIAGVKVVRPSRLAYRVLC